MADEPKTVGVVLVVPDPIGSQVAAARAAVGDELGAAIPTHITLLPPTVIDAHQQITFDEHLRRVAHTRGPVHIGLAGSDTFRPVSDVVFLAVGDGAPDCVDLNAQVCSGPVSTPSPFAFHPHITLAHDLSEQVLDRLARQYREVDDTFTVGEMCLYTLRPNAGWRVAARYPFTGEANGPRWPSDSAPPTGE